MHGILAALSKSSGPPVNTAPPVFATSGAAPSIGGTSTITPGTWTGSPALTYTLQRAGVNVGGATGLSHAAAVARAFVAADIGPSLRWVETGTNAAGSAAANSNAIAYTVALAFGAARGWEYDPADLAATPVSAWADRSPNAINLTASTTARPAWSATAGPNSQPAVTGDGVANVMASAALSPTFAQPYAIWLMVKNVTWVSGQRIVTVNGNQLIISQFNTTPAMELFAGSAFACKNSDLAVNTWGLLEARLLNGATSSLTVNANAAVTGSPGTASLHGQVLELFGDAFTATFANVAMALNVMITHDPTASERADFRAYCTWRFGVP